MCNNRVMSIVAALLLVCMAGQVAAKEGGVFTAGDLWESYLPSNAGTYYGETHDDVTDRWLVMRIGKIGRASCRERV